MSAGPRGNGLSDIAPDRPSGIGDALLESQPGEGVRPGDRPDLPVGQIKVTNLVGEWSTPALIQWKWQATGDAANFKSYSFVTGTSQADVIARSGSAQVWTAVLNPELGRYYKTPADQVLSTITDGHKASTSYFAQLTAEDTAGGQSRTNIASFSTQPATTSQLIIFSETDTNGYSLPSTFLYTTGPNAYHGSAYYEYLSVCGTQPSCWENLRRQDIQVSTAALPITSLQSALLEFAVSCEGDTSWWTDLWLRFSNNTDLWRFESWTLRCDGKYRLYQIPLRILHGTGGILLQPATLASGIYEFMTVGGLWKHMAHVRIDEVRLRW